MLTMARFIAQICMLAAFTNAVSAADVFVKGTGKRSGAGLYVSFPKDWAVKELNTTPELNAKVASTVLSARAKHKKATAIVIVSKRGRKAKMSDAAWHDAMSRATFDRYKKRNDRESFRNTRLKEHRDETIGSSVGQVSVRYADVEFDGGRTTQTRHTAVVSFSHRRDGGGVSYVAVSFANFGAGYHDVTPYVNSVVQGLRRGDHSR